MEPEDETNTEMIDVDIVDDIEDEDIADETLVMLCNEASLKMTCNTISMIKTMSLIFSPLQILSRGRCGRDHKIVGFTTTCAISAFRH